MPIETESIVNPLQQSKLNKKGLCDYVVNVASGCLHGCTFCYVPSTPAIRTRKAHLLEKGVVDPQMDWGQYLLVREDIPNQLDAILSRKKVWHSTPSGKGVVLLCSGTDPYQNTRVAGLTRQVVEILIRHGKRVRILTRSPLWTNDLDLLVNPLVTVGMSLPHLNDELSRKIEPQAPLPSDRLQALHQGNEAGSRIYVAMAPTPPSSVMGKDDFDRHFEAIAPLEPETIFWEPINARGSNGKRMEQAGLEFVQEVSQKQAWADNFLLQWGWARDAATATGQGDRFYAWLDEGLRSHVENLDQYLYQPTLEVWPDRSNESI